MRENPHTSVKLLPADAFVGPDVQILKEIWSLIVIEGKHINVIAVYAGPPGAKNSTELIENLA